MISKSDKQIKRTPRYEERMPLLLFVRLLLCVLLKGNCLSGGNVFSILITVLSNKRTWYWMTTRKCSIISNQHLNIHEGVILSTKSNFDLPPKKIICTRPCFRVHAFASDQGDKGVCDAVSENHSSSCYNCDQWRVRKMRGGWTGRRRRCSEQGWELSRTVKSCHAWLWSWLTVGPLCFTDLLTACLVVFQEENRSPCRLHQKITSPKLSLSLSHPSFSPPCHMMALKHGYPSLPCCWPVWLALQPHISTEPSWCQILRNSRRDGTKGGSHKKSLIPCFLEVHHNIVGTFFCFLTKSEMRRYRFSCLYSKYEARASSWLA